MAKGLHERSSNTSWQEVVKDVADFFKKPSVVIALLLITILFIITMKYDNMQRELQLLKSKIDSDEKIEHELKHDVGSLKNQMVQTKSLEKKLEREQLHIQKELKKKKDKSESWGEAEGE